MADNLPRRGRQPEKGYDASVWHASRDKGRRWSGLWVGPAGEYYVLFQLHIRGILASLAPRNAPTVDILVLSPDETVTATIQVKTRTYGTDKGWHMSLKHETISHPRMFYAFVDLEQEPPHTYIVPSAVVCEALSASHQAWLAAPGKNGRAHQDTRTRRLLPRYPFPVERYPDDWLAQYEGRLDLLLGASS